MKDYKRNIGATNFAYVCFQPRHLITVLTTRTYPSTGRLWDNVLSEEGGKSQRLHNGMFAIWQVRWCYGNYIFHFHDPQCL